MTVKQNGIDTTTSMGSNTILTMNGNEIEQISQTNFSADFVKTINRNYTTTTVTGLSEQDMHTYTFSAGTFATDGDTYYWHGGLTTIGTASAATNTFKLYVDGTVVMTVSFTNQGSATATTGSWDLTLMRKDATTLLVIPKFFGQRVVTTTFQWSSAGTQAVTLSNSFIIKVTGQAGQSGGSTSALGSILTRA
jgi:hypothetical protein